MDHVLLQSPDHLALVLGGVSFNSVVYLPTLPRPQPHTILGAEFREGVGSTGAGKALALAKLRYDELQRLIDERCLKAALDWKASHPWLAPGWCTNVPVRLAEIPDPRFP